MSLCDVTFVSCDVTLSLCDVTLFLCDVTLYLCDFTFIYVSGGGGFLGLGAAPEVINIAGGLEHLWAVTDR